MADTMSQITETGIIAILRGFSDEETIATANALSNAGIGAIEVTANTDNFISILTRLASSFHVSGPQIGVGTVLDPETAMMAIHAGAEFLVTPSFDKGVIETANRYGIPVLTGVATPTEAVRAFESGADMCKIFPANTYGPDFVSSLRGPLPQIPLVPTGGVTRENAPAYFEAGAVALGIGSSIAPIDAVENGEFEGIETRAREFLDIATEYLS